MCENKGGLIRRADLAEKVVSLRMTVTGLRSGKGVLESYAKEYRESLLRLIEEAPAVNAVEVVRCGECDHSIDSKMPCAYKCTYRQSPCYGRITYEDFGCLYGERKDNGKGD